MKKLHQIKLSDTIIIQVNQIIDYLSDTHIHKGKILEFKEIGESGWVKVENVIDQSTEWLSLKNWKDYYDKGLFSKVAEAFMATQAPTEIHI